MGRAAYRDARSRRAPPRLADRCGRPPGQPTCSRPTRTAWRRPRRPASGRSPRRAGAAAGIPPSVSSPCPSFSLCALESSPLGPAGHTDLQADVGRDGAGTRGTLRRQRAADGLHAALDPGCEPEEGVSRLGRAEIAVAVAVVVLLREL